MSTREPSPELAHARAVGRILGALGDATHAEQLALRACQLARATLGVSAAALFVGRGDDGPDRAAAERLATDGLAAELPDELPGTLEPIGLQRLSAWAEAAGYRQLQLAPLDGSDAAVGLFVLLGSGDLAPLDPVDLGLLGDGLGHALRRLLAARQPTAAGAAAEREHEQLVRSERMRALGDMALGIAHDFNNVLNAILGHTGVLARLVGDAGPAADTLEKLRTVALAGADTTRRVQEFSGQRRDRDFGPVALRPIVAQLGDELRARPPAGVRVDLELDGADAIVRGNGAELAELLRVLVDNAVEACGGGGTLTLALEAHGGLCTLLVRDDGGGMSPIVRRRAFDPFFTTKPRAHGLGLSVAWGIVRRHGGAIDLDSRIGHGTCVRVRLPTAAAESAAAPPPAPVAASGHDGGGRRVLLVEDDEDNREAMATLLSLSGFEVTAADCGADGVRAFSPERFDLVLTDLGLPDLDGWQVASAIKQAAPAMPIALITGWGLSFDGDEIRRRGVDLLIRKPLDPRGFLRQLEGLVQPGARKPSA